MEEFKEGSRADPRIVQVATKIKDKDKDKNQRQKSKTKTKIKTDDDTGKSKSSLDETLKSSLLHYVQAFSFSISNDDGRTDQIRSVRSGGSLWRGPMEGAE